MSQTPEALKLQYPGFGKVALVWTAIGLLTAFLFQLQRAPGATLREFAFMAGFTACFYPWIALTPLAFRLEKRFPLGGTHWVKNAVILALFSVLISLVAAPFMSAFYLGALYLLQPGFTLKLQMIGMGHFRMAELLYWCSVAGGYFYRTQFELRVREQETLRLAIEKSKLEAGLKQAQLDALRARLNPHFLFNSLQNISVLTRQDPLTASRMLARLGDLLRTVLRQDSMPSTTLEEELELTRAYVALEQMRFGDRLETSFEIDPETMGSMVPSFLLQPLIENAVIHGLQGLKRTGVITVTARAVEPDLVLTVADNGTGLRASQTGDTHFGIGLSSTRDRLATMYPNRHSLQMQGVETGGTEVRITIPLRYDEPGQDHEQPSTAHR